MSSSSPSNSLLFSQPSQPTTTSKHQLRRGGRKQSSSLGARAVEISKNGADYGAVCAGHPLSARSIISTGKTARGSSSSSALPIRNWSKQQLSLARMETKNGPSSSPKRETDCSAAASAASSGLKSGLPGGPGQPSASLATNATGGGVVAESSSARREKKNKEFVPDAKLAQLRQLFEENGIDAYIVPSEDAHQSEFMADGFLRRAYISGFTGSAGSVLITKETAALWTDGRYFLQAESQLGSEWTLMRAGTTGVPSMSEWIRDNMPEGSKVGIDPYLFSSDASEELKWTLGGKGHSLVFIYATNLVDQVWGSERPNPPSNPLRLHDIKFAGIDVPTKLANLRKELVTAGAAAIVLTMLDEIAWLLNLRGNDIPHCPVTYAYVIVHVDSATLFVDESKITPEVAEHLVKAAVDVKPYSQLTSGVKRLALGGSKLWFDPSKVSMAIIDTFNDACAQYYSGLKGVEAEGTEGDAPAEKIGKVGDVQEGKGPAGIYRLSPISLAKALKNEAEIEGMRQAHLRDAAAVSEFFAWLENKVLEEKQHFTEVEVAEHLDQFRAKQSGFLDTSFDTISGSGPNGAIVHYRAQPGTCGEVNGEKLLLLDSGAQYVDGTTDITRTVHFGVPTSRQRECFTRVLQGHIAVDKAIFPEGTPGFVLDVLARTPLWKIGLDYRHGTGHGVGAALNVHEGPQGISYRFGNLTGLQAGMIVSNEPGYYEDRAFGIRIENVVLVREEETENRFGGVTFLGFDRLTVVPIQAKLVELSLLSEEEIKWLNDYHTEVWDKVSPLVKGDALEWLQRNTRPISPTSGPKRSEELATSSI